MWNISCTLIWNGYAAALPAEPPRRFHYLDRFKLKYDPWNNWWLKEMAHDTDTYRLVLTYCGPGEPLAVVCGFWVVGNPPIADTWHTEPFTPGLPWRDWWEYYFPGMPTDRRMYAFTT